MINDGANETNCVEVYQDDLLIHCPDKAAHYQRLMTLFPRLLRRIQIRVHFVFLVLNILDTCLTVLN